MPQKNNLHSSYGIKCSSVLSEHFMLLFWLNPRLFSFLTSPDRIIMSAEFEWNSIVLLQKQERQEKDCISIKWAIDLRDDSQAPRWVCQDVQVKVREMIYNNY